MAITNNVDQQTQQNHSFLQQETQLISKDIDKMLEKGVTERNFKKILDQILLMVAYQARVISGCDEEMTQNIVAQTRENIEKQVGTFGGGAAWGHAWATLGIYTISAFAGLGVAGAGVAAASQPLMYIGKAGDSFYEAYKEGSKNGPRTAYEFEGRELQRLQSDSKDDKQKNGERTGSASQTAGQINNAAHDIFNKLAQ